ncbi:hypothetical protein SAMN05421863_101164 [Nitrosomonas communis]|uniref:Uncharacterized protein n=1 Tax=Nitrosomonas communis TaxID=44574 RepID=A0A1I4MSD4_9PROT|nr:hypothetical protein SAMN05421863_101164 [Nitrosomonas communis]
MARVYIEPAFGGKCLSKAEVISSSSRTISQAEEKLRKHDRHGLWVSVVTYVKCQPSLIFYLQLNCYKKEKNDTCSNARCLPVIAADCRYQ